MEALSNEYQSSSSTTLEEDDTEYQGSDRVLSGISEDTSFSSNKTACNYGLTFTNPNVVNTSYIQLAKNLLQRDAPRKSNSIAWAGSGFGTPISKSTELESLPILKTSEKENVESKNPHVIKSDEEEKVKPENQPVTQIGETKNVELPSAMNNKIEKEHNCLDNLLEKPLIVSNVAKNTEAVSNVSEMPQKNIDVPLVNPKTVTNRSHTKQRTMGVHRGKTLGFGEKETDDNEESNIRCLSKELHKPQELTNSRPNTSNNTSKLPENNTNDGKKGKKKTSGGHAVNYWTGYDEDSYQYIEKDRNGLSVVRPTHSYPGQKPSSHTVSKDPSVSRPASIHGNNDTKNLKTKTSDSNKTIHDDVHEDDFAVSPVSNIEHSISHHNSVVPIITIRLKNGVAKSIVEARLGEIEAIVHNSKYKKRNWRTSVVPPPLSDMIDSLCIGCTKIGDGADLTRELTSAILKLSDLHLYRPNSDGALSQDLSLNANSDESAVGSQLWNLPCIEFENIWQNLFYNGNLKNELMSYVYSLVRLSESGVDTNIITVHRMIMLLGPPGTGKTSLCKGLAQLLSIQLNHIYPRSVMIEINSHSLFSKWFSESGKLVQKMFDHIDDLAEDGKCMVFVLIDEVESLGMSRDSSSNRGDPADSIRAVNALITQIDRIRRRKNILIMCTSNLEKCLDSALIDRVDFVRHVGQPSQIAMYTILYDCVKELQRVGIVDSSSSLTAPWEISDKYHELSSNLWTISSEAIGLSGRAVRQIPALVCAMSQENTMSLEECLKNMRKAIDERRFRRD